MNQDIIRAALDILSAGDREIELTIVNADGKFGGPATRTRHGTLTGLGSTGDQATVTVNNYRFPDGQLIAACTLVGIDEIISLAVIPAGHYTEQEKS